MDQFQEILISLGECGDDLVELRPKVEQLIYLYQRYLAPDQFIYSSRKHLRALKKKYRVFPLISYELYLDDCDKFKLLRSECNLHEYERLDSDLKYILFKYKDLEFLERKILTGREIEEQFGLIWVPSRLAK
jgi:hypothetical protein